MQYSEHPLFRGCVFVVPGLQSMMPLFVVIRHQTRFDRIHKVHEPETLIGREATSGIALGDPVISRKHALLFVSESDWMIRDLGSRNGTRINGIPVSDEVTIADGSRVEIGPYLLQVCFSLENAICTSRDGDDSTQSGKRVCENARGGGNYAPSLTAAQRRVYDLLMTGLIEKEIAARLGISSHTVHDHVKAIYRALSVSTRGELLARAITQHG